MCGGRVGVTLALQHKAAAALIPGCVSIRIAAQWVAPRPPVPEYPLSMHRHLAPLLLCCAFAVPDCAAESIVFAVTAENHLPIADI